jgi:hypothetical protein
MEGGYTDLPVGGAIGPGYWYWNFTYRDGFSNQGNLMGNWMGRGSQGAQAWSNYWLTPKSRIQFNFRHEKVSPRLNPGGSSLTDVGARADIWLNSAVGITASVQYERWLYPAIQPGAQQNVTTSVGIQFEPHTIYRPPFHHVTQTAINGGDPN